MPNIPRGNLESGVPRVILAAAWGSADVDLTTGFEGYAQGRYPRPPRMIIFEGGDLVVNTLGGDEVTIPQAYEKIPIPAGGIKSIDTTAAATSVLVID